MCTGHKLSLRPIVVFLLQIMIMRVSAARRPFTAPGPISHFLHAGSQSEQDQWVEFAGEAAFRGMNTPGSRPPRCDYKCQGCVPCEPIQVPTTSGHLGVQYSNYEPEGWKCKCRNALYNP